eukprot:10830037-Alexandrium_andersonii.AAC.1
MSASLVGSEMCIRDRLSVHDKADENAVQYMIGQRLRKGRAFLQEEFSRFRLSFTLVLLMTLEHAVA